MYELVITDKGRASQGNIDFLKKFDIVSTEGNIFCYEDRSIVGKPPQELWLQPYLVIVCLDRNRTKCYSLLTRVNKVKGGALYRGIDVTEPVVDFLEMKRKVETNEQSGLQNLNVFKQAYRDWFLTYRGRCALIEIEAVNMEMYKTLYGDRFYNRLLKAIYGVVIETFGVKNVYHISAESFLATYVPDTDKDFEVVRECSARLNRSLSFDDGNAVALPDVRLGVLDMTLTGDIVSLEDALDSVKLALDNAKRSLKSKVYVLHGNRSKRPTDFDATDLLDKMLAANEIEVYYQPQINANTRKIVAFEALTRIVGEKRNEISVFDFIRKMELCGGIIVLGKYVMQKAMDFATKINKYDVEVSINASPIQLMQSGFVNLVKDEFNKRGLKPGSICIEVTEGALMYSFEEVKTKLLMLSESGISVHIDDFGVAYSSLTYVKRLPCTVLKIDKSFIDDLEMSDDAITIVKAIINMARGLKKKTTAEGVENKRQFEILQKLGCDYIQGYYFSRALPADQAIAFLEANI